MSAVNVEPQNQPIDLAREAAFSLGVIEVRPATREVVAGGVPEVLEPRVMQVLVALARRRAEVVSRDELILSCWGGRAVGDDAINRCIARIRRLAETHGGFFLETIPRVGYRLIEVAPATAPDAGPPRHTGRSSSFRGLVAAALALAAGLAIVLFFRPMFEEMVPTKIAATHPLAKLSIAVLPFTPLYADPGAQHLGDSIALRLADTLTNSPFDIISPAKSMQYRGAAKAGAAQALHADFLIDGEVRREQGMIHVAMRVIDGQRNITVVAGTFDRAAAEADSLPDQIAAHMSSLSPITHGLNTTMGWDSRVVAAYFRATYLQAVRKDFYGANETARETAQIVPKNGFAQALHGFTAAILVGVLPPEGKPAMAAEARDAANRAIRLYPSYGDSYAVLAMVTPYFDWAEREDYLKKGLMASPDAQEAQLQVIELLQHAGRFRESSVTAEKLLAGGQSDVHALIEVINARLWQDKPVRALITQGGTGMQHAGMGMQYSKIPWFAAKMFEEAAFHGAPGDAETLMRDPAVRNLLEEDAPPTFTRVAVALHYRRPADIEQVAKDCANPDGRGSEVKRTCFMALVALGRLDDAYRLAALLYPDQRGPTPQARQQRWFQNPPMPAAYLSIPQMAPLRADPRFREVVERIGLLQYWKSSHRPPDFCAVERAPVCVLLNP
ncbi:MAG TPA: winged helix-turn-helix domain-containing protein [Rhizomicrobium sp.]|nr:winged helix-turn-helix domain-containing protein [Rhizomicrobium sp.]